MNSWELEEKLEKDNMTLKEHILKLQQTIKQIKSEMMTGDPKELLNPTIKRKEDSLDKNTKNKENKNLPDKYLQPNLNEEDNNNLKFSFNVRDEKKSENKEKIEDKGKEEKLKANIFKDNFTKIRQEKEIIEKTEKLKKESNLVKKYLDGKVTNQEELMKFQKNIRNNYINDKKKKFIKKDIEDDDESLNEEEISKNKSLNCLNRSY